MTGTPAADADRQLPRGDEIFLDHVAHFVHDPKAASEALVRAGFAPTPISIQVNPDTGGRPQPTGTGNVTAMLRRGYIEVLFKTADTPLAREFDAAMARYAGLHLAAFSVRDAAAAHRRLHEAGFRVRPLVEMARPVETEDRPGTAAFTIVRIVPGEMPEGRIQILTHRSEDSVWQPRWLAHRNGAHALTDLVIIATDTAEAAQRFARFTGRTAAQTRFGHALRLDRGTIQLATPQTVSAMLPGLPIPGLPFVAAYGLLVRTTEGIQALLEGNGLAYRRVGPALMVRFPRELGTGAWVFAERPDELPWRSP